MKKWLLILIALAAVAYQQFKPEQGQGAQTEYPAAQTETEQTADTGNRQIRRQKRHHAVTDEADNATVSPQAHSTADGQTEQILQQAYELHRSDIQVQGEGVVVKTLPDDNKGSRHQRFILKLSSGQTLLVAHNIDLADKIKGLKKGDRVGFNGEYEWSKQGGVIHWTHHDPNGSHADGWLAHNGKMYQ
ncbi:DUF3465 domain-containing protein [Neisseria perflava]|uniref:DUF3465 domain-containing protein n=1 Tax=Neisseria perflava TaxID=33053 RepID=UPI00209E2FCA|nr:DUF3465 domain-containing protein [Neisseria perflava]MCP1660164.1 glucan-binding YG repeat protein [Neisseria perflava]MCP1772585.1 glucan-binding YG repeat protein [Neisseria perflava]